MGTQPIRKERKMDNKYYDYLLEWMDEIEHKMTDFSEDLIDISRQLSSERVRDVSDLIDKVA